MNLGGWNLDDVRVVTVEPVATDCVATTYGSPVPGVNGAPLLDTGGQPPAQGNADFGVILDMDAWEALAQRLREAGVDFVIEPYVRFRGEVGEQATLFLLDPSGNALEFKGFADERRIFARAPLAPESKG